MSVPFLIIDAPALLAVPEMILAILVPLLTSSVNAFEAKLIPTVLIIKESVVLNPLETMVEAAPKVIPPVYVLLPLSFLIAPCPVIAPEP